MADNIGQLYYQVERISDDKTTITTVSSPRIASGDITIFGSNHNIVSEFGAARFTRLGIQAPPGTKVVLNRTHSVIIGRTGVYELEADITHMYFVKMRKYERDEEAILKAKYDGSKMMHDAEVARIADMSALPWTNDFPASEEQWEDWQSSAGDKSETYWNKYIEYESKFDNGENKDGYNAGLALYQKGRNGIYKLPYPEDPSDDRNFIDLRNIVIDFIYSTT